MSGRSASHLPVSSHGEVTLGLQCCFRDVSGQGLKMGITGPSNTKFSGRTLRSAIVILQYTRGRCRLRLRLLAGIRVSCPSWMYSCVFWR